MPDIYKAHQRSSPLPLVVSKTGSLKVIGAVLHFDRPHGRTNPVGVVQLAGIIRDLSLARNLQRGRYEKRH